MTTNRRKPTTKRTRRAEPSLHWAGALQDRVTKEPLAGYQLALLVRSERDAWRPVATVVSQLDGGFSVDVRASALGAAPLQILVKNRFGHEVHRSGTLKAADLREEMLIRIAVNPALDRPIPLPIQNPFQTLKKNYAEEIAALAKAGVKSPEQLATSNLHAISRQTSMPVARLDAFRLHGELNESTGMITAEAARLLVSAGVTRRADLATANAQDVARSIGRGIAKGTLAARAFSPQQIPNWIAVARGWNPAGFVELPAEDVSAAQKRLYNVVSKSSPWTTIDRNAVVVLSHYWAQIEAIAEMRAIMSAAGIYDLASLDPFIVRGVQRIGPGYHFSLPNRRIRMLSDQALLHQIVARGAGFQKVTAVRVTDYGLHIVPNPVTDAVILGSLVSYIENGQIVIGKDVTQLIIVTDHIDYHQVNQIVYEGAADAPPPQAKAFPSKAGPPRAQLNDRHVYSPDVDGSGRRLSDNGANGLPGLTGLPGAPGYEAEAAPLIKIYVRDTPSGLPDINLNGRPGGRGGDGQDGGDGEDGAKGRESTGTFWVACVSEVGHGGNGGNGGMSGDGGPGGTGGRGGSVAIYATDLQSLFTRTNFFIGISGGTGGDGGSPGNGGAPGIGGEAGHDTAGCDAHPDWHGADGVAGVQGKAGPKGPEGAKGNVSYVPITPDQFNAAFHYPFLLRLEPHEGPPGTLVTAVGLNFTTFGQLYFDRHPLSGTTTDTVAGTIDFTVPDTTAGGLKQVGVLLPPGLPAVPGLDSNASNPLGFRVTPRLDSVTPPTGVPGMELTLNGAGFVPGTASPASPLFFVNGSQARFGGRTLPLVMPTDPVTGEASTKMAILRLPFWEDIALPAGPQEITVVNPDGSVSNPITLTLSLEYALTMRAWRVGPNGITVSGGGGIPGETDRPLDEIRDLLANDENSPAQLWLRHGIRITLDPRIDWAYFPHSEAESFPHDGDPIKVTTANPGPAGMKYVDPAAINVYFVEDIDDSSTSAFAPVGATKLPTFLVFEDTASLSTAREALVASHEVGHILGLQHVCAKDEDVSKTLFNRVCITPDILHSDATSDMDYLMYPRETWLYTTKGVVLEQEAIIARRGALMLMQPTRLVPPGV